MNKSIPIVLSFTENYFVPVATCISSILKNSDSKYKFEIICLLTNELPSDLKELLESLSLERLSFNYFNLDGTLEGVYVDERYTIAASFRLLIPELLKEYDQVIYLDCDIIVRNDLGNLFETIVLSDYYLAAVYETVLDFQIPYLKQIGCEPGYYFNSGFLLMNLKSMRRDNLSQKLIDGLKVPYLQFPDQDVLNIYCKDKVLELSPIYNSIRTFFLPQYKKEFIKRYTESLWDEVQKIGTIHYTGNKPWNSFTVKFDIWWKYYWELPEKIKAKWSVNKKLLRLYRFYSTAIGGTLIDKVQKVYRKF